VSSTRKQATGEAPTAGEILQSIARSLNLLVKLKVNEAQGDRKVNEMILLLHSLGCRPVEIAEALGKTPNHVNPVISRARKAGGKRTTSSRKKV
jgi:DNA-directed RNA polymerase specialized sigma24 family protein